MRKLFFALLCVLACSIAVFAEGTKTCSDISTSLVSEKPSALPSIVVKWQSPTSKDVKSIFLYRDTKQILSNSIKSLKPIAELEPTTTQYIDKATNSQSYFYCALAVLADGSIYDVVIPSVNATINAIAATIPKEEFRIPKEKHPPKQPDDRSAIPLPYLNILSRNEKKVPLSEDALNNAIRYQHYQTKPTQLPLYIFPEDIGIQGSGEKYLLTKIINTSFIANDWDSAESNLKDFLKINHTEEITRRANFYLGQVLYYQGYFRDSLNCFIIAKDAFPAKTTQWIEAVLERM